MVSLDELVQKVDAYQRNRMSLKEFDRWFEDNVDNVDTDPVAEQLRLAVDAALAAYYFDRIEESVLREELAEARRAFVSPEVSDRVEIRLDPNWRYVYVLPSRRVQSGSSLVLATQQNQGEQGGGNWNLIKQRDEAVNTKLLDDNGDWYSEVDASRRVAFA